MTVRIEIDCPSLALEEFYGAFEEIVGVDDDEDPLEVTRQTVERGVSVER